jgi:UDP-N-acetylmuramoylalanine--D-glutamate ligase
MSSALEILRHKKICVLGLGKTGCSAVEFFKKNGIDVVIYDDNKESVQRVSNLYSVEEFTTQEFDILFVSPGIPNNKIRKHHLIKHSESNNIPIISDIEILQDIYPNAKYIGVTGTNGKSTTVALINHILTRYKEEKVKLCGNIGVPVLSVEEADIYILELSSYQIDLLKKLRLNIAICINITPDHLDSYLNIDDYTESKARIFSDNSLNIISIDYPQCKNIFSSLKYSIPTSTQKILDVGVSLIDSKLSINNCLGVKGQMIYDIPNNDSLLGKYNAENIVSAVCVCISMGVDINDIIEGIESFHGLPHRLELVLHDKKNNVVFINDSKATNVISTRAAFEAFKDKKVIWIAGGLCKDDGIESLKDCFGMLKEVYLVGRSMDDFHTVLNRCGINANKSITIENALQDIKDSNPKDCVVLLSPACASTDQWKNFEERGDYFKLRVKELF